MKRLFIILYNFIIITTVIEGVSQDLRGSDRMKVLHNADEHKQSTVEIRMINNSLKLVDSFEDQHFKYFSSEDRLRTSSAKRENKIENADGSTVQRATTASDMEEIDNDSVYNENENDTTTLFAKVDNITDFYESTTDNAFEANDSTLSYDESSTIEAVTKPPKKKKSKSHKKLSTQSRGTVCYCDLTRFLCDVNCCCDLDCIESDKAVFTKCIEEDILQYDYRNTRYCTTKGFLYKNNTRWLSEASTNDLFCVLKDNLPPVIKQGNMKIITTNEELSDLTDNYFLWSTTVLKNEEIFDNTKSYVYDDNIWIMRNFSLKLLEVPFSKLNSYCDGKVLVKYLHSFKSKCLSDIIDTELYSNLMNSKDIYLISTPSQLNETWISSPMECPQNVCIPLSVFTCDLQSCQPFNVSNGLPQPSCQNNFCTNLIASVEYSFLANGTNGYTNVSVFYHLLDMFVTSRYIEREYEISQMFVSQNSTKIARTTSGNPGYGNGEPIISAKLMMQKNNDSNEVEVLDYFLPDTFPLRNTLGLPKNKEGYCLLSNISYDTIKFRENVLFECKFVMNISNFMKEDNASGACRAIEKQFYMLMPYYYPENYSKIYISTLGNPSLDIKNWIELLHEYSPAILKGVFDTEKTWLECKNIILKARYRFAYSSVRMPYQRNQLRMVGAGISHRHEDAEFRIKDGLVVVRVRAITNFVDVKQPKSLKYARGPHFHIYLPDDFFYPFTMNQSVCVTYCYFIYLLLIVNVLVNLL